MKEEIRSLVEQLQEGYHKRDFDTVDDFIRQMFCQNQDVSIIGTSAINHTSEEWCEGLDQVKQIIVDDWKYWGDFKIDFNSITLMELDNVAHLTMVGQVEETMKNESYYQYRLNLIEDVIKDDQKSMKLKLLDIMRGTADTLFETECGEDYNWPIRLSALVVKEYEQWKFKHIHFSYPITFYPPVRQLTK